jgi:hypothetical protein
MSCTDPITSCDAHQDDEIDDAGVLDGNESSSSSSTSNILKRFYARHQVSRNFLSCSSTSSNDSNNNNDTDESCIGRYRFIRLNPRYDKDETLGLLRVRFVVLYLKTFCHGYIEKTHTFCWLSPRNWV